MGKKHEYSAAFKFTSKGTLDAGRFERLCRAACSQFCKDIALAKTTWTDPELLIEAAEAAKADFIRALEAHVPLPELEAAVLGLTSQVCIALIREKQGRASQSGPGGDAAH
jgi:hypothetical protein